MNSLVFKLSFFYLYAYIVCFFNLYFRHIDIDECTTGANSCGKNSNCVNDIGSYYCDCKKGFLGDGEICEGEQY